MAGHRLAQPNQHLTELGGQRGLSAASASSRDPACDTTPSPSAVAVILGRVVVACTSKVPLRQMILRPQQAQFPLERGTFSYPHTDTPDRS